METKAIHTASKAGADTFEEDVRPVYIASDTDQDGEHLYLKLESYEGPLDLLLDLARDQKVDLAHISILTLVDQYIGFIESAKELEIVIAADYLVMASWLAYLKSKLLLPQDEDDEVEPSGQAMADALTFQLKRLVSMRERGADIIALPKKNINFWPRGNPEGIIVARNSVFNVELIDILKAYGDMNRKKQFSSYKPEAYRLVALDEALDRMAQMLGRIKKVAWKRLQDFLPKGLKQETFETEKGKSLYTKSAIASTFVACLELAKRGDVTLRQDSAFSDIYLKRKQGDEE